MPKKKTVEVMAGFGFIAQIAFIITGFALHSRTGSLGVQAQTWFMVPGLLLWVAVYLHSRQKRLAHTEKAEMKELRKGRLSEEIFEGQELDRMRANTGLKIFEKYLVPAFSVVLAGILAFLCYRTLDNAIRLSPAEVSEPMLAVAGMAAITFFGFLLGKYAVGLSHSKDLVLLRAPASYLMGNVITALLLVVSASMVHFGVEWPEAVAAHLIPVFMGLVAFEVVINIILDIYRPKVAGQEWRPAYDSRLLNLCAEPAGVFETFAAMVDYQFGFKISDTWLYSFMQRAILPLLLIGGVALWSLSSLAVIHPGEAAFIERWGRPRVSEEERALGLRAGLYGPGYHLKLPWPIESVRRIDADHLYSKVVGKLIYEDEPYLGRFNEGVEDAPLQRDRDVVLWGELHIDPEVGREAQFLVPSMVDIEREFGAPALNIARLMARLQYRIKRGEDGGVDPDAAYNFYYRHTDPHRVLENLAFQTINRIAASQNFLKWIHVERKDVSERFEESLRRRIEEHNLGIEIVYAGLPSVHPPAAVSSAYESVINAYQRKETLIHEGERDAIRSVKDAESYSAESLNEAKAYRHERVELSEAEQDQFRVRRETFEKAPAVYRSRQYFSAVEDVLAGHHIYIVPVTEKEVNIIDMKGERPDGIMDLDLEGALQ